MDDAAPHRLPPHPAPRIRAGEAEIDLAAREVDTGAAVRRLEPRAAAVLAALMAAGGAVVTRETLLDACWGEDGGSDEALTQAVAQLRRAFADDPRRPRFIGTVPKAGYRWLAPAAPAPRREPAPRVEAEAAAAQPPHPAPRPTPRPAPRPLPWAAVLGGLAVLGAAAGALALARPPAPASAPAQPQLEIETEDVTVRGGERVRTVAYYNGPRDEVRAAMRRNAAKR